MNERLKEARKARKMSQEVVAKEMFMSRSAIVAIEAGTRKVVAEELVRFAELYSVTIDELVYGKTNLEAEMRMFARAFVTLPIDDKREVMNLIRQKRKKMTSKA